MKFDKNIKLYSIIALGLITISGIILYFIFREPNYDLRDQDCKGKTIKTAEYNFVEKKCSEVVVSACLKPIYKNIEDCKKQNGLD